MAVSAAAAESTAKEPRGVDTGIIQKWGEESNSSVVKRLIKGFMDASQLRRFSGVGERFSGRVQFKKWEKVLLRA
eukprot:85543-Prorocentrum_minimum.AAC.1